MIIINTYFFLIIVGIVLFAIAYSIQKWGGVKLLTKGKLIFFIGVFMVYQVAPYAYQRCEYKYQDVTYLLLHYKITYYLLFAVILLVLMFSWIKDAFLNKDRSIKNKIGSLVGIIVIILIITLILYSFLNSYANTGGGAAHIAYGADRQKMRRFQSLYYSIESFFKKFNRYPVSFPEISDKGLLSENPTDPVTGTPYDYAVAEDGNDYVLRTRLGEYSEKTCHWKYYLSPIAQKGNQSQFNDWQDLDGVVYGLDCDDPFYCTQSEKKRVDTILKDKNYRP